MTVQAAAQWLRERDNFLLLTHVRPDGDTLGSAAALCQALNALGKTAYVLKNPGDLTRYEGFLTFSWAPEGFVPDHVVAVDIATEELLPEGAAQSYRGKSQLCIDHHPSNEGYAQQTCLDADASACGEIIYHIIREWGVWSQFIAQALYIAIATDCGGFLYSNTTPETHRIAAELMEHLDVRKVNKHFFKTKRFVELKLESRLLESEVFFHNGKVCIGKISLQDKADLGAGEGDCEELSSFAATIEGVGCAATLRELAPDKWKISLRTVDVSVKVTNTGDRDGVEIVQLYIRDKFSSVTRPVKELKDFTRVLLKAGESQVVNFKITPDKLAFYDKKMKKIVEPGEFIVMVGASSDDKDLLKDSFFVK